MKAVVVAHGEAEPSDAAQLAQAELIIAADGGAVLVAKWGHLPHEIVGDFDSLGEAAAKDFADQGSRITRSPAAKDESDTELALQRALDAGATETTLLAALGGSRLDHELANLLLLADPKLGRRVTAVRGGTTVRALHGGEQLTLSGDLGDLVTLLPIGGNAEGVTTGGLSYQLRSETLTFGRARGLSNRVESTPATVKCDRGVLLVIEIRQGSV